MTLKEERIRDAIKMAFITGRLFERDPRNFSPDTVEEDLINEIFERNVRRKSDEGRFCAG